MGAQVLTTIDFGAFPGKSDASVVITGQAGIIAGSAVEGWLIPLATADHSADEHLVETIRVVAGSIVAGTGFTIYAMNTSQLNEPLVPPSPGNAPSVGGQGTRIYGLWSVAGVWN